MVKLFTDAETALGCSNWRPIPLYLQEPILAVPKKVRTKVYTDIPISNTPTYQAPISPHVFAQNAQSLFQVNPTNFMGSYDALLKRQKTELFENPYHRREGYLQEYEGLYRTENAFAGASGGGAISQNLVDIEASAEEMFMEQVEAQREGTGLIKTKKPLSDEQLRKNQLEREEKQRDLDERGARGEFDLQKDFEAFRRKNPSPIRGERITVRKSRKVITPKDDGSTASVKRDESIATPLQTESMPGLITQTKTDEDAESIVSDITDEFRY